MASEWVTVPVFGGGLNFAAQPGSIEQHEWSWCNGFFPDESGAIPLPRYIQLIPATRFAGEKVFGVLMNPYAPTNPILILTYTTGATDPAPVHLYVSDGTSAGTTEITWDGIGTRPTRYQAHRTAPQGAFLNGWFVITCGSGDVGFSLLQWNGGATFATVTGGGTYPSFRCAHLESFSEHLIGAAWGTSQADMRRIRISDAESTTVWKPNFDNSADDGVLDDSVSGIVALALLNGNTLGIFTRAGLYGLAPTGNIPPFTRSYLGMFSAADGGNPSGVSSAFYAQTAPLAGPTPAGIAHAGYANLYLELNNPIGNKIWRYLSYQTDPPSPLQVTTPRLLWHHRLRTLIVSTIARQPPEDGFFYFNPFSEGWGWQSSSYLPGGTDQALCYLGIGLGVPTWTHVVADVVGNIWGETAVASPRPGIYVDTKDFTSPLTQYVDAIRVDWEPLFPNSMLRVSCLARDGLNDGIYSVGRGVYMPPVYGTPGYEQNLTTLFAEVPAAQRCLLSPGATENALRAKGKTIRFRFEVTAGSARIRGFAFRQQPASDRLTDVRLVVEPRRPAVWNTSLWNADLWTAH